MDEKTEDTAAEAAPKYAAGGKLTASVTYTLEAPDSDGDYSLGAPEGPLDNGFANEAQIDELIAAGATYEAPAAEAATE